MDGKGIKGNRYQVMMTALFISLHCRAADGQHFRACMIAGDTEIVLDACEPGYVIDIEWDRSLVGALWWGGENCNPFDPGEDCSVHLTHPVFEDYVAYVNGECYEENSCTFDVVPGGAGDFPGTCVDDLGPHLQDMFYQCVDDMH